jgi:hypothetical protein
MVELLADWVRQGDDRANPVGHRPDALLAQREAIAKRLGQPFRALVGEICGVRLEHLARALGQELGEALQRPVTRGRVGGRQCARSALGALARLGDRLRCGGHRAQRVLAA